MLSLTTLLPSTWSAKINCSNRRQKWPCASTTTWKLARMNLAIRGTGTDLDANFHDKNFDNLRRLLLQ